MLEYLYSYRTCHNTYADVWARDAEHAKRIIAARDNRPRGFWTLYRVTNVPAREVTP